MMTRWEHEALSGMHGEEAREQAKKSWGRYLGACMLAGLFMFACGIVGIVFLFGVFVKTHLG
jgi:hypothetical protein